MKKLIIIAVLAVSGCAHQVMTGWPQPPKPYDSLGVYYDKKSFPKCNPEELSFIRSSNKESPEAAVNQVRKTAAKVGADFIYIRKTKDIKGGWRGISFYVEALSYSCDKVDRENFDTHFR